jgi:hypothetical protein
VISPATHNALDFAVTDFFEWSTSRGSSMRRDGIASAIPLIECDVRGFDSRVVQPETPIARHRRVVLCEDSAEATGKVIGWRLQPLRKPGATEQWS